MEARRRGVEADIPRHHLFGRGLIEGLGVGKLMDEAARFKFAQEIGFEAGHLCCSGFRIGLKARLVYHALGRGKTDKRP